jgi:hypothetical protein
MPASEFVCSGAIRIVLFKELKRIQPIVESQKDGLLWSGILCSLCSVIGGSLLAEFPVKPIIYSGRNLYNDYLKTDLNECPIWMASYGPKSRLKNHNWKFHQFSDKIRVSGIRELVDANDFNGSVSELFTFCLP